MTPIFMFPGQSSKHPAMFEHVVDRSPQLTGDLLDRASAVLGWDPRAHYAGEREMFSTNLHIQVGVFLANHIHMAILHQAGVISSCSLGLSLGEYNHLVHIGALTFEDALRLIVARGRTYDEGPQGKMAAVYPISAKKLLPIIADLDLGGVVEASNLNSPYQQVISGDGDAVEAALRFLQEEHELEGKIIEHKVPMHCSVFRPAADALSPHLAAASWLKPQLPYFPNVLGRRLISPTGAQIQDLLHRHAYQPVLWETSIRWILANVDEPAFVEVGPGAVLHRMLQGRWCKRPVFRTNNADMFDEALHALSA